MFFIPVFLLFFFFFGIQSKFTFEDYPWHICAVRRMWINGRIPLRTVSRAVTARRSYHTRVRFGNFIFISIKLYRYIIISSYYRILFSRISLFINTCFFLCLSFYTVRVRRKSRWIMSIISGQYKKRKKRKRNRDKNTRTMDKPGQKKKESARKQWDTYILQTDFSPLNFVRPASNNILNYYCLVCMYINLFAKYYVIVRRYMHALKHSRKVFVLNRSRAVITIIW